MRQILWDESFRRALKRSLKKRPQLQQKITETLNLLELRKTEKIGIAHPT